MSLDSRVDSILKRLHRIETELRCNDYVELSGCETNQAPVWDSETNSWHCGGVVILTDCETGDWPIWNNELGIWECGTTHGLADFPRVDNYSALPPAATHTNEYYHVLNSQGTSWLPGPLGGTYYSKGFYFSNGVTWSFIGEVPYQATQIDVDAGIVTDQFVTPATLANATTVSHPGHTHPTSEVDVPAISGANLTALDEIHNYTHSTIALSGGNFTDNGDGTIDVAAGNGQIRATDSITAEILQVSWATKANLALVDNDTNYIYLEYNGGTPQIVADTNERTDLNTNIFLGQVFRDGNVAHIYDAKRLYGGNHNQLIARRLQKTQPFARESGASLSEVGTRNIAITAGVFWEGVDRFFTNAFDSSTGGTFIYWYRDGLGGFTKQTGQTQISNSQYDNGSGALQSLTVNHYTNAWVYLGAASSVHVVYGRINAPTIATAEIQSPPSDVPEVIANNCRLIGRIIIRQGASSFDQVDSSFTTIFSPSGVTDHNTLSNLQGGAPGDYQHLTSAELTVVQNTSGTNTGDQNLSGLMVKANNLSDVANAQISRNNILPSKLGNQLKHLRVNAAETDYEVVDLPINGIDDVLSVLQSLSANREINLTGFTLSIGTAEQASIFIDPPNRSVSIGDIFGNGTGSVVTINDQSKEVVIDNNSNNIVVGINKTPTEALDVLGSGLFSGTLNASNLSGSNTGDDAPNSLYSGLVSNATHTGEVTGDTTLTVDKTAITNKTLVTADPLDHVLIADASDSNNLKKVLVSDFGGGSGLSQAQVLSRISMGF